MERVMRGRMEKVIGRNMEHEKDIQGAYGGQRGQFHIFFNKMFRYIRNLQQPDLPKQVRVVKKEYSPHRQLIRTAPLTDEIRTLSLLRHVRTLPHHVRMIRSIT